MAYIIDVHVHCRDWSQFKKERVGHAHSVARKAGLSAIFEMPNTDPALLTEKDFYDRIKLVPKNSPVFHGIFLGVTADLDQVRKAADLVGRMEGFAGIMGLKMYAGESTGGLTVSDEYVQQEVYKTLADAGYRGVLSVHCEKESYFNKVLWNSEQPITHSLSRPIDAEVESIKDQIKFAIDNSYRGILNITHISSPRSVDLVTGHKKDLKITSDVTMHHLLLDDTFLERKDGLLYKMNPPLRDIYTVEELYKYFKEGRIDMIGTDHAPHTEEDKREKFASGIPALHAWKRFRKEIELQMPNDMLEKVLYKNAQDNFKLKVKLNDNSAEVKEDEDLSKEYWYDPFASVLSS